MFLSTVCVQAYREWDFSNMLTVLLRFNGRPVAAAVLRVFGQQLAELPLVATRPDARRQGHARVMVRAIEAMLVQLGVQVRLVVWCQQTAAAAWSADLFSGHERCGYMVQQHCKGRRVTPAACCVGSRCGVR
jgi:GNAT superfamily N-acetyltransferase